MTISYEAHNLGILAPATALPVHIKGTLLSEAVVCVLETHETTIAVQQCTTSDCTFIIKSFNTTQPVELSTQLNTNAWLWQGVLEGEKITTNSLQHTGTLVKNQLLISPFINHKYKTTVQLPGSYTIIEILLTENIRAEFESLFPGIVNKALTQTLTLDTDLHQLIRSILTARLSGNLWNYFIEARIKDILFHTCNKLATARQNNILLEENELQAVNKAAEIIAADIATHIPIPALARKVGLNEFKLKKFFPLVHGKTIYAYLVHMRMCKAKELLQQNYTVKEVAAFVGYRPSDLTITFMQHFGMKPSQLRKK